MPSDIIATVGAVTANSYGTEDEAADYFEDRLHKATWTAATASDRVRALLWATKVLDTRVKWKGVKTSVNQALDWPRAYVDDPDVTGIPPSTSFVLDRWYIAENIVPSPIKYAQFELALALLSSDLTLDPKTRPYKAVSVGPIAITLDPNVHSYVLPLPVRELIDPFGTLIGAGGSQVKLLRA